MRENPRFVTGRSRLHLEAAVVFEQLHEHVDNRGIVIDHQDPLLAGIELIERNLVLLHELDQAFPRNTPEARPGHTETLQPPAVEAPDHRLLADLADLGDFACRVDALHPRTPRYSDRARVGRACGPDLPKLPMFTTPYNPFAFSSIVTFNVDLSGLGGRGGRTPAGAYNYEDLRDASRPIQSVVMSAGVRPAIRLA